MRAMVLEDDFLLAGTLVDALTQLGYEVHATAASLQAAIDLVDKVDVDFAVADLDLKGAMAYPVLDRLIERAIPFVIATCTSVTEIPARFGFAPTVSKPYDVAELRQAINRMGHAVARPPVSARQASPPVA